MERLARLRTVKRPPPRRNPRALAVTAVAAVVVTGLIAFANAECLELVVASSNEKSQLLADIAKTYPAPQVDRRCVTVKIIEKASGAAERALRRDWAEEGLRTPHVWSPAATTWLVLLAQHRSDDGRTDIVEGVAHSLMQSPLAIAMPESMANALPNPSKIGWQDIYDLARKGWGSYGKPWGPFRLGKTDPTTSTSGLHALISVNYAAQRTSDPDEFVRIVEQSVVHYGDTVRTVLRNLRAADDLNAAPTYVSAIAVEEKQVFDYNNPATGRPPREKLKAIHPTDGTLVADHPYAILTWTDAAHKQAAADFEEYLSGPTIQARFQAAGFRNYLGQAGAVLESPYFDKSGPKGIWKPPDPKDLVEMLRAWRHDLRKPAHALFVVDVGRSMSELATGTKITKLDLATRAASVALDDLAPKDDVGLWTFPTTDGTLYRVAAPTSTVATSTSALARALPPVGTSGDEKGLYGVIRASVDEVRATYDRDRINAVVVLTGGGYPLTDKTAANGLIDYLLRQPLDQQIPIYVIAYGTTSKDVLQNIAESSGGAFYDATTDQVNIGEQLRNAMSNF